MKSERNLYSLILSDLSFSLRDLRYNLRIEYRSREVKIMKSEPLIIEISAINEG